MLLRRFGFAFGTLCVCGLLTTQPRADSDASTALPQNIIVHPELDDIVVRMMQRSSTFRDQCQYLGSIAVLRVRVFMQVTTYAPGRLPCRADAHITRYQYGRIEARVRLPSRHDAAELIAHELEHVREFVEGTDYRYQSARFGSGVWLGNDGHYETNRAVAIGRRVASEVEAKIAPE